MGGALKPRTRLKPRGGFSFLPLQRRIQQLDVLKERPLTDLSSCFKTGSVEASACCRTRWRPEPSPKSGIRCNETSFTLNENLN